MSALFAWIAERRSADRETAHRLRHRDDAGFSLTELLIASTLLVVLLTVVMISVSLVSSVTDNVTSQYEEYDQAIPALAPLQSLIRAEVEPGPATGTGAPTPGFGAITNSSLTFYANIGTAYGDVDSAGSTAGPAEIVAEEIASDGQTVASPTTSCTVTQPCSFQVREYLPKLSNVNGVLYPTCPVFDAGINAANPQVPTEASPNNQVPIGPCLYRSSYTLVSNVLDVVNSPLANQPIFTYSVLDSTNSLNFTLTPTEVQTGTIQLNQHPGYPSNAPSLQLNSCSAPGGSYPTCPLDAIQSVGIDLWIAVKGAGSQKVDNDSVVYRYPEPSPNASYPYQYSTTTG
jgi:prepilin-type N-terminal cleavage/methylation domain-containing protein